MTDFFEDSTKQIDFLFIRSRLSEDNDLPFEQKHCNYVLIYKIKIKTFT